jgi:hypothetical protein
MPEEAPQERISGRNGRGPGEPVRGELLREVNARIRDVADASSDGLEFVCECGDGECEAMVMLSMKEYDGIRVGYGDVLAVGHRSDRA